MATKAKRHATKSRQGHKATGRTTKRKSASPDPILTLTITGPGVRKGRIPIPDLIKVCEEAQNAVTRQAEALEGRKSIHPGPTTIEIREECTLELVSIKGGCTLLGFDIAKPQMLLPLPEQRTLGLEAIEELVNTIHSLGNGNKKEDLDPGVLRSIYGISGLIDKRVTSLTWSTKKGGTTESIQGKITKKVRERVAAHLSQPRFKLMLVDGVLDMADFNRRDRKCRIDPAIGTSVICSFGVDLEGIVQSLLRSPVRVKGLAKIQPDSDRVESLEMKAIEPLSSLDLGEGNFFASHTIKELVETQGVKPFAKASATAWLLSDEEVADFVSEIYGARERL